jgi:hypothetical protein
MSSIQINRELASCELSYWGHRSYRVLITGVIGHTTGVIGHTGVICHTGVIGYTGVIQGS